MSLGGELPSGLGKFSAGELQFAVDDGYSLVPIPEGNELNEQALDHRLVAPNGAPLASWILARLTHIASGSLALQQDMVEICEGGVFVIDFVVRQDEKAVGKVQLQAGREGAALLGVVAIDPILVIDRFVAALQAEPLAVGPCCVRAWDPSWPEGVHVEYGYDGSRYL